MKPPAPLGHEHQAIVRRRMAERGIEITPDELAGMTKEIFGDMRLAFAKFAAEHGFPPVESDEEMFLLLFAAWSESPELRAKIDELADEEEQA